MLKIGEFSILSKISIYMLRHYDEIGLLIPAYIDNFTGYRYYTEKQLPIANRIQALKGMGVGLNSIKEIILTGNDEGILKNYLVNMAGEKRKEIEYLQTQLHLIEMTLQDISNHEEFSGCIAVKDIPGRNVLCYRDKINAFNQEGKLWSKLNEEMIAQNAQLSNPRYAIAVLYGEDIEKGTLDIEVQRTVVGTYINTEQVHFKTVKPMTVAALTFKGGYSKLHAVNEVVARWVVNNHYELNGQIFNIYHVSPETESSMDNLITEVCFPIKEKSKNAP